MRSLAVSNLPVRAARSEGHSNEVLLAIASNAIELLEDAELLFAHGRHARAAALAVLCAEEVGKFFLFKWQPQEWERRMWRHQQKQSVVGTFNLAEAACKTILTSTKDLFEVFSMYSAEPNSGRWDESDAAKRLLRATTAAIAEASGTQPTRAALTGEFTAIKNASLYVDLDATGRVRSSPCDMDRERATECLSYARSAVERLRCCAVVKAQSCA